MEEVNADVPIGVGHHGERDFIGGFEPPQGCPIIALAHRNKFYLVFEVRFCHQIVQPVHDRRLVHAVGSGGARDFDQDIRGLDILQAKIPRLAQAQIFLVGRGDRGRKT